MLRSVTALSLAFVLLGHTAMPRYAGAQEKLQSAATVTIPDGTELYVLTTDEISSKDATEGDPVNFRIAEDVVIDGRTVFAKGTLAKGTVTSAVRSGRMGKGGKLGIRLESTYTVDRQRVKLRAAKGKKGNDKTTSVIALTMFVSVFFLLKKGHDAKIKEGTRIQVYTDEEKVVGGPINAQVAGQQSTEELAPVLPTQKKKKERDWTKMSDQP
jgi:hypothetical protein